MTNFFQTQPHNKPYTKLSIMLISILLLSGCGEFAYKRGASVADLENSKKTCLAKGGDAATIDKCLEDNGWIVQKFNEPDPVADVGYTPDNRAGAKPINNTISSAATVSTVAKSDVSTNTTAAGSAPLNGIADAKSTSVSADKNLPAPTVQVQTATKAAEVKVADPMDTFKISSWWKMGSGPDGLKIAIDECVSTLGEKHRPELQMQMQNVTRGLLVCMREKGWRGLRAK
ncbi:MAG TPA: hypothetical protein VK974_04540 [Methylophilaceae bacterium]|nr:hypothetical protein [Methylophilaceae bacterium]